MKILKLSALFFAFNFFINLPVSSMCEHLTEWIMKFTGDEEVYDFEKELEHVFMTNK